MPDYLMRFPVHWVLEDRRIEEFVVKAVWLLIPLEYYVLTRLPNGFPAIPGLGTASGFDFELQDRGSLGHDKLMQARDQVSAKDFEICSTAADQAPIPTITPAEWKVLCKILDMESE